MGDTPDTPAIDEHFDTAGLAALTAEGWEITNYIRPKPRPGSPGKVRAMLARSHAGGMASFIGQCATDIFREIDRELTLSLPPPKKEWLVFWLVGILDGDRWRAFERGWAETVPLAWDAVEKARAELQASHFPARKPPA